MNDPLAPLLDALWHVAVPTLIVAAIAGTVAGLLAKRAEDRFIKALRALFRPRVREAAAEFPTPDAPHCPECNRLMVRRKARRGASVGAEFWGCVQYPRCRGTRSERPN